MTLMPTNGPYDFEGILDTPGMRRQQAADTLMGLAQGFIAAGAPSPYPRDPMSVLAMGVQGGLQGANQEDKYLKRAMVNMQAQKLQSDLQRRAQLSRLFNAEDGPQQPQQQAGMPAAPVDGTGPDAWQRGISNIESGGRYDALGPEVPGQGRAHGKYQIMPANIGPWTKEILGTQMTPEEFLKNPQAQDAVFKGKFGQYVQQYGTPEAAARAWFAGPGGMNNPNASDVNGMTVANYGQRFMQGAGGAPVAGGPQPSYQPQTLRGIIQTIPKGLRQIMGQMDEDKMIPLLMKYADPETVPAIDNTTGQMVYAPKPQLASGRFRPIEADKFALELKKDAREEKAAQRQAANDKVIIDPVTGQPTVNTTLQTYEVGTEAGKQTLNAGKEAFQQEKQLRDAYESQPAVKSYRVVVPMLESAQKAGPTRAGDLNLVYAFAKLMDPDSVVRESETGAVSATASVADRLAGYINQLNGNAVLSPETRAKLMDELKSRFASIKESNDVLTQNYADIAKAWGLDPSRVAIPIRTPGSEPGTGPSKPAGTSYKYVPGKGLVSE